MITPELLQRALPIPEGMPAGKFSELMEEYAPLLEVVCVEREIQTPRRLACFLAQTGHESMSFLLTRELWGPTADQLRYEGRADLGNNQPGDGKRFRGRGLIQLTGRANYAAASAARGVDFLAQPELLEESPEAAWAAGFFWAVHACNEMADGLEYERLTRRINGGLTGYDDRCIRLVQALRAVGGS